MTNGGSRPGGRASPRGGASGGSGWIIGRGPGAGLVQGAGLYGFGGVLFTDEDLQEAELCLDPLVFSVLVQ